MQQPTLAAAEPSDRGAKVRLIIFSLSAVAVTAALIAGMAAVAPDGPPPPAAPLPLPLVGTNLIVACPDPVLAADLRNRAAAWAARTGATVTVSADAAKADIAVVSPADVGRYAVPGELAVLPSTMRQGDHTLQWVRVLSAYRSPLSVWGREVVGMPLAGDAAVLVYRADLLRDPSHQQRFREQNGGRDLLPPATWDDLAAVAAYFAEATGKPSLPPLPAAPDRFLTLFHQIAVPADRKAVTEGVLAQTGGAKGDGPREGLSVHFDTTTGQPRVGGPGFAAAADWLAKTRRFRPAENSDDPAAALADGTAAAAVLTLAELARLPRDPSGAVAERFGVTRVPGAAAIYAADGSVTPVPGGSNYVPYLGARARVGVVFKRSAAAGPAWDLLAELAGVSGALAELENPLVGGPFRSEQLEEGRAWVWSAYGFDPGRTKALGDSVRGFLAPEVGNPATVLRVPNHAELSAALVGHVRKAANGEVPAAKAVADAAREWEAITARDPTFREKLRASVGLQ